MDRQLTTDRCEALPAGHRRALLKSGAKSGAAPRRFASHEASMNEQVRQTLTAQVDGITSIWERPPHSGARPDEDQPISR